MTAEEFDELNNEIFKNYLLEQQTMFGIGVILLKYSLMVSQSVIMLYQMIQILKGYQLLPTFLHP